MNPEWLTKAAVVLTLVSLASREAHGLKYLACFKENSINDRLLKGARKEFKKSLTPEICLSYCKTKGMRYFGLQYSYECFCSVERPSFRSVADENECNMQCEGNPRETCGGGLRLSVYDSEEDLSIVKYVGCYKERSTTARLMTGEMKEFRSTLTNQKCIEHCRSKGFTYAGTQWAFECFCSNDRPSFKSSADEKDCNQPCDGNQEEMCGAGMRLSVYDLYDKRIDHVYSNFLGCYGESDQQELQPTHKEYFRDRLTPEFCVGYCYRKGYRYAGMRSGNSCYCGTFIDANSKVHDQLCSSPCTGDKKLLCGGAEKISIYHTEISDQSEEGKLLGCFEDNGTLRTLSGHMISFKETLTPRLCLNVCLQLGFKYSGVEAGYECHCGNRPPSSELEKPEHECSITCPGDRLKMCGGNWRLLVFSTGGASSSKPIAATVRPVVQPPNKRPFTTSTTREPTQPVTVRPASSSKPQSVRPASSSKPQTVRPASTSKPQTVRPASTSKPPTRPVTTSKPSWPSKPTNTTRPVQSGPKPSPKPTKPQYSPTTTTQRPQKWPVSTLKPSPPQTTLQETSWNYNKPTQQQTTWGGNSQATWPNKPDQQTSWSNGQQGQTSPNGQGAQTTWPNNQPEETEMNNLQTQTTWPNSQPVQTGMNQAGQTTWPNSQPVQTGMNQPVQTTWPNSSPVQNGMSQQGQTNWPNRQPAQSGTNQQGQTTWPINQGEKPTWANSMHGMSSRPNTPSAQSGFPPKKEISSPNPYEPSGFNAPVSGVTLSADRTTNRPCMRSLTEVKGENVCKGQTLFHDSFSDGRRINAYKWSHEVLMPWTPDYEFVVYRKNEKNSFLKNQKLYIRPTLLDDDFVKRGLLELESCTGLLHSEECRRHGATFNIIPPIESARLTTKDSFSFKYGRIDVRAKLPRGDWIVPEIWLEPKRKDYGTGAFASGRVRIAMARGNTNLEFEGREIGNRKLEVGILMGVGGENIRARTIIREKSDGWHTSFHNYTLIWTPDNLKFLVDGQHQESLVFQGQPLYQLAGFDEELGETWKHGSLIAPFDKEFYITLGLSVGGMRDFPDESRSNGREKPWRNMAVKAMASFWEDRWNWKNTWDDENSALQVESVTVTAV